MVLAAAANHSGISSNVIANANANLAKGDVAAAAGDPSTAIKDYKAAWAST